MKLKPQGTMMSPRCITMVLEIFLELPATVMVTMSELQANRLLIPHPHDFRRTSIVCTSRSNIEYTMRFPWKSVSSIANLLPIF